MVSRISGSQQALHRGNRAALLDAIHKFGALTQIELAEKTGLSTGSVSNLVHQMVDDNILETEATIRNGRRATLVTYARQDGVSAGLSIDKRGVTINVINNHNEVLAEHTLPLQLGHKSDAVIQRCLMLISETMDRIGASVSELLSIGIAVNAPVNARTHEIALAGILRGWENVNIGAPFEEAFHVPTFVNNDANMSAIAEANVGVGVGHRNFIYILAGDGVGSGIIINGHLWTGVTGLAGEIGHVQVDPLGSICSCGNRGCLNTVVDEDRLVSLLSVTHGDMTLDDLIVEAVAGDPGCRRVIADSAIRVGSVVSGLCIGMDPEIVIVGGKLSMSNEIFIDPFQESLRRLLFPDVVVPIQVLQADHPVTGGALGAAIFAMGKVNSFIPAM
ncbi:MAG: ROK family transcriptional regulator [Bifidobacterium aquikefiri]|uniref:NagC family transcriptional regulator n=1 Tax=Bifidobacterium aquikefiri TaxID=1653207 RepID=A0A261G916_9BIFI|nr:ROK family transcriptional regulator [Bifidobacterium aquikefiri]OZG67910.1 NagC family transcriptional regulator [Bifidobacterium aquikefiri]